MDEVSNNMSYDSKKMTPQKSMNDCILKSFETAKVSKNDEVAIFVTDEEISAFSYEKTEVVSIDLKAVTQTYLCSVCHEPVIINNALASCKKCENTSLQSQSKLKAEVKMVILNDNDQLRSNLTSMYHTL